MQFAPSALWTGWPPLSLSPSEGGGTTPEVPVRRRATLPTDTTAHDGHSLTDAYVHNGPYPTNYRAIRNSIMDPDSFGPGDTEDYIVGKSTIPGSSISWRLGYDAAWDYDPIRRSFFCSDPSPFKEVTVTEAGPPFRLGHDADKMKDTLRALIEFCELAHAQGNGGAGARVNLWSIWPQIDGWVGHPVYGASWGSLGGFRQCLPEYGRSFKFMADYANWKMRQLHPGLPADWHVFVFPGHLWWERICADLDLGRVPGFTTLAEMMHPGDVDNGVDRPIHPGHVAAYGLAALAITLHYQIDLTAEDAKPGVDVFIPAAFTENRPEPESPINWPAVSREYAEYCWRIAWEIASAYGPAGMGGTEGMTVEFDGNLDADPLAPLPPVEVESPIITMGTACRALLEGGQWVEGYTPALAALAGTSLPTPESGYLAFRSSVIGGAHAASGARYGVIAIRILDPGVNINRAILQWVNDLGTSWNAARLAFELNAWTARYALGDGTTATQAAYAVGVWQVVEFWTDATEIGTAVQSGASSIIPRETAIPDTTGLMIGGGTSYGSPDNPADFDLAGLVLCDGVPTSAQRAKLAAWAAAQIPETT